MLRYLRKEVAIEPPEHTDESLVQKDFHFNDDLLLSGIDRDLAQRLYPDVAYALDHPELRKRFEQIDPLANRAKRRSRVWGCWAVALISLALLLAAAEPVLGGSESTAKIILGLAGVCSLAGTLIGFFGILYADSKQNWLENRLRTERMRLFHFGTILALSNLILAGQKKEFLRRRADLFEAFDRDVLQRPRLALDALVDFDDDGEDGLSVTVPPLKTVSNDTARQLVAAYCRLRVGRQLEFAQYKLRKDGRIFSAFPTQQAHVLGTAAVACILGLVLAHFIVVIDVMFVNEGKLAKWSHAIGFGFGIAAVAFRTLLEGLQSSREVERYRHYRAAMKAAADRMDAESTFEEKLRAAEGIERVSADEMVIFLRASMEARFVM